MEKLDLKCTGYDLSNEMMNRDAWAPIRNKKIKDFITRHYITMKNPLFIGHWNGFDNDVAEFLGVQYINTGNTELDELFPPTAKESYDFILCFDVIEHLMNPLLFLKEMKKFNMPMIITYPRHPFVPFWGITHFHEFNEQRFFTLVDSAGFKIQIHESFSMRKNWWKYFKGFRKVMRLGFLTLGYPRHEIYLLG